MFYRGAGGREPTCQGRRQKQVQSLGREDLLEENMATHSSILAWRVPWTEEEEDCLRRRLALPLSMVPEGSKVLLNTSYTQPYT